MRFRNDDQRKAVFANMFKGGKIKGSRVNSNSVINFEVKSSKALKSPKIKGLGRFERSRMPPIVRPKKVKLKSPLFPPTVVDRRIDTALSFFFEDLETYAEHIGLNVTPMKKEDKTWKNNVVEIEQIQEYADGRPKKFRITFNIPSFVAPPPTPRADLDDMTIGKKHILEIGIPAKYPDMLGQCSIDSKTTFWSSRMLGGNLGRICLHVNGEIDRIAMHLMQQLLWEPSIDSHSLGGPRNFAKDRRKEVHEFLEDKMKEMHNK